MGGNSGLGRSDSNSAYYSSGYNEHSSAYGASVHSGQDGGYGLPNSNQGAYESGGQHQSGGGGEAYDLRSSNQGQDQRNNIHHDQHRSSQGRSQETATSDSMIPYLPINDRTDNNSRGPHQPRPANEPYYNSNESGAVSREPQQGQEPEGGHMYQYNANRRPERSWDGGGGGEDSNDGGTQEVSI